MGCVMVGMVGELWGPERLCAQLIPHPRKAVLSSEVLSGWGTVGCCCPVIPLPAPSPHSGGLRQRHALLPGDLPLLLPADAAHRLLGDLEVSPWALLPALPTPWCSGTGLLGWLSSPTSSPASLSLTHHSQGWLRKIRAGFTSLSQPVQPRGLAR